MGEQVTDNAYLLDWHTGEVLKKVVDRIIEHKRPGLWGRLPVDEC